MPAPSPMTKPSRSSSHGREARSRGVVEVGRERPRRGEARDAEPADRGLGAARDHHVGVAERDQPRRVADRVGAGRAGGHHRVVRPLEAEADRDLAAHQVDQARRDEERADPARAALLELDRGVGDGAEAADAGADQHAGALPVVLVDGLPAGVRDRLDRGGEAVDDEQVVLARLLGRDHRVDVEVALAVAARHQARDLGRQIVDREAVDPADAALACGQPAPDHVRRRSRAA